jgi:uncharacterized protein YecT (DUF1311 family)
MKKLVFIILCFAASQIVLGQTQAEINRSAQQEFIKADKQLNDVYQKILQLYKSDTAFVKNLKASQRLWVQFREAEVKMKYPDREPGFYGSIAPTCWSAYRTELTQERIETLKQWVKGVKEADDCSGSIRGTGPQ